MTNALHLLITTPASILVNASAVVAVRATDSSGSFGILPNHTDLVTALDDSVIRWRNDVDNTTYCAVRRGVLMVINGNTVRIACREGLVGSSLSELNIRVREYREQETDTDREEASRQMRLRTQAMRRIMGYLGNTAAPMEGNASTTSLQSSDVWPV